MKKAINLNSAEWCEIIFEGKNKEYGAYAMRQSSGKRHIIAFGIIILFVALVAFLPSIISKVNASVANNGEGITETHVIAVVEHKQEEEKIVLPDMASAPPIYRNSIKVTPPVITKDEFVADDEELHSMDDILDNKKLAIGTVDMRDGTDDLNAELKRAFSSPAGSGGTGEGGGNTNTIFKVAEVMPQFPGGPDEMYKYISENLKYPVIDQEMGTQGRVTIQFVVSQTGEIKNVVVLRGVSPNCDKEALRVVKSMPKWIPGKQNGNAVQVYFTLPISFKLKS